MGFYVAGVIVVWLLISIGEKLKILVQNSRDLVWAADLVKAEVSEIASEVRTISSDLEVIKAKVRMIEASSVGFERQANGDFLDSDLGLLDK